MADVAERAGVSIMTVSRVLNRHPSVTAETRRRVERAIERLGYRPNSAARTLATGRSATIGVVSVETPHYGPTNTLFGIEGAARAGGLFVSFVAVRDVNEAQMRAAVEHLRATNVDGIVVVAPIRAALDAIDRVTVDVPIVVLKGATTDEDTTVAIDQAEGSRLATQYLLELGHRTVHHVRGPRGWPEADARADAWAAELRDHSIRAPKQLVGDWTPRSGYEAGQALAANTDVTAIFVANDQMALGVLLALHEAGRRVPDDVSVVGFDDIPEAAFFNPPLTTVRQDFDELGRRCVHQLTALMRGDEPDDGGAVHPTLVQRSSTAPVTTAQSRGPIAARNPRPSPSR
jgi:DNA-binding LacI/PurR family transcriptional regulator